MQRSKFFVGIGSQKAGTSWLWAYLQSHPQVGLSPVKEFHLFDSKYTATCAGFNRKFPRIKKYLRRFDAYIGTSPIKGWRLLAHYLGTLAYREGSYRKYLDLVAQGKLLGGEITPSYAMLEADGIQAIETALDRPNYLWILRNPADRFWSHIRYRARWKDDLTGTAAITELLGQDLYRLHSAHKRTYLAYRDIIAEGRLHIMFYEHVFDAGRNQQVCDALCDFLGLEHHQADRMKQVNVGDKWSTDIFDRAAVVAAMAEDYRFFAETFGQALPQSWQDDIAALEAGKLAASA